MAGGIPKERSNKSVNWGIRKLALEIGHKCQVGHLKECYRKG